MKYDQIFSSETNDSSRFQDSILDRINPFLNKINNEKQQFQTDITTNTTNLKFEKSIEAFLEGKQKDQEYIQNHHQQDISCDVSLINMLNSANHTKSQNTQGSFVGSFIRKEQYNNALKDMSELANKLCNTMTESQVKNDNYVPQTRQKDNYVHQASQNEVKYYHEPKKQQNMPQSSYLSPYQQSLIQKQNQFQQQDIIKQNSQSNTNTQQNFQSNPSFPNHQSISNPAQQLQQAPLKPLNQYQEQTEKEKEIKNENKLKFDLQQFKQHNFNVPQKTNLSVSPPFQIQTQNSQTIQRNNSNQQPQSNNQYTLQQNQQPQQNNQQQVISNNQYQFQQNSQQTQSNQQFQFQQNQQLQASKSLNSHAFYVKQDQNYPLQKSSSLLPQVFQQNQNFSTKQHRKIFTQGHKQLLQQAETNYHQNKQIKYPFNQIQAQQQPKQNEELPVFCINCEEYVKLSQVNVHSRTKCQKKLLNLGLEQPKDINEILNDINGKLDYIMKRFDYKLKTEEVKQKSYINSIQQIFLSINEIIENNSDSFKINQCVQIILRERQSFINYTDNLSVLFQIFSQRSIVLAEDKALKIKFCVEVNDYNIKKLENELRSLDNLTQKEKANLEFWKFQADMMEDIKKNDLKNLKFVKSSKNPEVIFSLKSEIESDVQSQTGLTITSGDFNVRNTIQFEAGNSGEEQKRLFYTEAVSVKLNLPPNHRGRDVLISDLYNEAMLRKIPKTDWQQFLKQKLS